MKAMVLCAGAGTRLGDLTRDTAKCLLPVQGRPLLEHILEGLEHGGIDQVILNFVPGTPPERIRHRYGSRYRSLKLSYSHEPQRLGTAGSLKYAEGLLRPDEEFLVQYGDILSYHRWPATVAQHRQTGALVTCVVHCRPGSNSRIEFNREGRVTAWLERPTDAERRGIDSSWANSSLYVCRKQLLDYIPPGAPCDLPSDIFPALIRAGQIWAHPINGHRVAVDSPERLEQADALAGAMRALVSAQDCRAPPGRAL